MRKMNKILCKIGLSAAFLGISCVCMPFVVHAAVELPKENVIICPGFMPEPDKMPEQEELFAGYVEKKLYEGVYDIEDSASAFSDIGKIRLNSKEKQYFEDIQQKIQDIADGKVKSTKVVLDVDFTWTAEELGVDKLTDENYSDLLLNQFNREIDMNKIWSCLRADCPYEMYWYDKTKRASSFYISWMATDGKSATARDITILLPVCKEYQDQTAGEEERLYTMDSSLPVLVEKVKTNAEAIVDKYADATRYEKMNAYQKEICEMVSYHDDAGSGLVTDYGNPWQLLWVFDEDESTKVVCEGYAKAFQYLCELSGINCYNVTGTLSWDYGAAGSGAGAHMWNIVPFGGKNYLVDVTNIEHLGDFLFMTGEAEGTVSDGYNFLYKEQYTYTYTYFEDQIALYGEDILKLADQPFDPSTIIKPELQFKVTAQNVLYTGREVQVLGPTVTVNGEKRTDLEVTYGYREVFAYDQEFIEGLPTEIGLYDVIAYIPESDLCAGASSNIIMINVVEEQLTTMPTAEPTPSATEEPTPSATAEPTPSATAEPTPSATAEPTPSTTEEPTPSATEEPTPSATEEPTPSATEEPTPSVTEEPTPGVTEEPTPSETEEPTPGASEEPTPTVTPEEKELVTAVFEDVYEDWYTVYIQYVYDNDLMTGIKGTNNFAPDANITKAQVAQVLYNMENQPTVENAKVFTELTDVYPEEWYANAVAWAYSKGVVTGNMNDKKFLPNADVTREQLALMMFRYAKFKGYDVSDSSDFKGLESADQVADWSEDGVRWAVGAGLISGVEKDGVKDLAPQGNATRAQIAAILQRFCNKYWER